jgi:flagella basal body P-ring formation protein FlgA
MLSVASPSTEPFQSVESIRAVAIKAIPDSASNNTTIELGLDNGLRLPQCDDTLSASLDSRTAVAVSCPNGWRLYVPLRVRRVGPVVVLTRPVAPGTVLDESHLHIEERDLSRLSVTTFDNIESVIGKQVTRSLAVGSALGQTNVSTPISIRRGDAVVLLAHSGSLEVRAAGRALTDGRLNELLSVKNLVSQRVLQGTLRDNGVVELVW